MKPSSVAEKIRADLDAQICYLLEIGLADDANFSVLRSTAANHWEVTFDGAAHIALAMSDLPYEEIYDELDKKRSYNLKLADGGLLQFTYAFEGERLMRHRLAFYPSPRLRPFPEDPDAYLEDQLYVDIVNRRIVPFPLRFDFDDRDGVHKDVEHPRSHMTVGDVQCCRVPVTSGLTPRWLMEFILRNFYQSEGRDLLQALPAHRLHMPESITANERRVMHICVPHL